MNRSHLPYLFALSALSCGSTNSTRAPAQEPSPLASGPAAAAGVTCEAESSRMRVSTGTVHMSGGTEVYCKIDQDAGSRAFLNISVTTACTTIGVLHVELHSKALDLSWDLPLTLDSGTPTPLDPIQLPMLPERNAVVRTRLSATCGGPEHTAAWANSRCVVP